MIDKNQLNRVQLANQLPLNKLTVKFLPGQQPLETELAVLTLMRWGLDNGLGLEPLAPNHPSSDQLMARINRMTEWEPRQAMAYLTNPEGLDGEEVFSTTDLAQAQTPDEAAKILLEALYNAMVATAP